ncbi:MAG TPA: LON peptidase substrate-binding domain-containing protein [Gemmatimonadaceae bacterium]|nr:LON peptidase substrate-binding domain-containing protein [Gemmatimonadaceae bacterium]
MPATRLPIFPLNTVLFPGARMPLRIFEPRYRTMLRDCLDRDRVFGLIYREADADERALASGTVGCRAHIDDVEPLADGRANIVVTGRERFVFTRIVDDDAPYFVAEVDAFDDSREPVAQVTALALRLRELFVEAAHAARTIADEPISAPDFPDDPEAVAFAAASSIDLELADRQRLLSSPSPGARMRELITVIDSSLPELHARAESHRRAKLNGHGPKDAA